MGNKSQQRNDTNGGKKQDFSSLSSFQSSQDPNQNQKAVKMKKTLTDIHKQNEKQTNLNLSQNQIHKSSSLNTKISSSNEKRNSTLLASQESQSIFQKQTTEKDILATIRQTYFANQEDKLQNLLNYYNDSSQNDKMSKHKLLEYFGLVNLENTEYGDLFFENILNVKLPHMDDCTQNAAFLSRDKFLTCIGQLSGQHQSDQISFIFNLFDQSKNGYIDKNDMYYMFVAFYESLNHVDFENEDMNNLKIQIEEKEEDQIGLAIQDIVNEIYQQYSQSRPNILELHEFQAWILADENMKLLFHSVM